MSTVDGFLGGGPSMDRMSRGQVLLWATAAVSVLAAHAGGVVWALRNPPVVAAEAAAPAAVMIDMAPETVAPEASETDIAPDLEDAQEVLKPVDPSPTPPVLDPPSPMETAQEMPPPPISEVADVAPPARPEPVKPPEPKPEPKREVTRAEPRKAAKRAQVQAPPAATAAAKQTSSGSSGAAAPAKWQSKLMAHLERRKRYPAGSRGRREQGVAQVRFSIDDSGKVLSARIAKSSGFAELDEAALALVQRSSPVPPPPAGAPHEITAPIQYRMP